MAEAVSSQCLQGSQDCLLASISGSPLATCQIPIHKCHGESVCHTGCVYVALTEARMQDPICDHPSRHEKCSVTLLIYMENKQLYTVLQLWTDGCTLIFLNIWGKKFPVYILNVSCCWFMGFSD